MLVIALGGKNRWLKSGKVGSLPVVTTNFLLKLANIIAIAISTLCLVAAITGVAIAFYCTPDTNAAKFSIEFINDRVANGWVIIGLHNIAGNGLPSDPATIEPLPFE